MPQPNSISSEISAHQYDKLQNKIEFQSGQVLLFSNPLLDPKFILKDMMMKKN